MSKQSNWQTTHKEFLKYWTLENIKSMKLEDYTNTDRADSFTYWLEKKTENIISIWGGSAYKFGVFKRDPKKEIPNNLNSSMMTDDQYGWYSKYGKTRENAFDKVKQIIIKIVEAAISKNFKLIDSLSLGNSVKWKIAYMYAPNESLLRIVKIEALQYLLQKHCSENNNSISYIQQKLIEIKPTNSTFYEYSEHLWREFEEVKLNENNFKQWLESKNLIKTTINKYVRQLKKPIPKKLKEIDFLKYQLSIFDCDNELVTEIKDLFTYNEEIKKWNNSTKVTREASAAINNYFDFLKQDGILETSGESTIMEKEPDYAIQNTNTALNQILYGPPGTGKTYNTILEAAKIVDNNQGLTYEAAKEIFNEKLGSQIEFITFHQNYSYEDFIQGLRPDVENERDLVFERKDGIFKAIADKALDNLLESENKKTTKLNFEIIFNKIFNELIEGSIVELEIKMKKSSFYITNITNKSIEFRKQKGASNHTLSLKTLLKMYNKGFNDIILGGLQPYYNPLLELLLKHGERNTVQVKKKNYVIIIDEINRANISRVFGELITLIEPDKRSHGDLPLSCTLPSGDKFIVPSNLYIIGTMNTADKSITLLDIALRRRFDFVAMYPRYNIDGEDLQHKTTLKKLNDQIIKSKGHDFQIGHSYFMGDTSLKDIMNKKVIPLLLEYYMNDEKEVKDILTNAGLTIDKENIWPVQITG